MLVVVHGSRTVESEQLERSQIVADAAICVGVVDVLEVAVGVGRLIRVERCSLLVLVIIQLIYVGF